MSVQASGNTSRVVFFVTQSWRMEESKRVVVYIEVRPWFVHDTKCQDSDIRKFNNELKQVSVSRRCRRPLC